MSAISSIGKDWNEQAAAFAEYVKGMTAEEVAGIQINEATKPVEIKAYAVQAQGARPSWSDVKVMSVADIAAWFDTCAPDTW